MADLTPKQKEVWDCFIKEHPKILMASGTKWAGKTFVFILLFLIHIAKFENQGLSFIMGGSTQAPIRRNIFVEVDYQQSMKRNVDKINRYKKLSAINPQFALVWVTTTPYPKKKIESLCVGLKGKVYLREDLK